MAEPQSFLGFILDVLTSIKKGISGTTRAANEAKMEARAARDAAQQGRRGGGFDVIEGQVPGSSNAHSLTAMLKRGVFGGNATMPPSPSRASQRVKGGKVAGSGLSQVAGGAIPAAEAGEGAAAGGSATGAGGALGMAGGIAGAIVALGAAALTAAKGIRFLGQRQIEAGEHLARWSPQLARATAERMKAEVRLDIQQAQLTGGSRAEQSQSYVWMRQKTAGLEALGTNIYNMFLTGLQTAVGGVAKLIEMIPGVKLAEEAMKKLFPDNGGMPFVEQWRKMRWAGVGAGVTNRGRPMRWGGGGPGNLGPAGNIAGLQISPEERAQAAADRHTRTQQDASLIRGRVARLKEIMQHHDPNIERQQTRINEVMKQIDRDAIEHRQKRLHETHQHTPLEALRAKQRAEREETMRRRRQEYQQHHQRLQPIRVTDQHDHGQDGPLNKTPEWVDPQAWAKKHMGN